MADLQSAPAGRTKNSYLLLGPVLAAFVFVLLPDAYTAPSGESIALSPYARYTAAVGLWMGFWWMTEALPVYITAMLPVATPPNAIVFGSGKVSVPQMSRAGFILNLVGIVLVTGIIYSLLHWVLV